jgi:hypothetical protein
MGLFSFIVTLPLQPVEGVISLAELIQRQVEQELHDPARARRALEEARERDEITEEEEKASAADDPRPDDGRWRIQPLTRTAGNGARRT